MAKNPKQTLPTLPVNNQKGAQAATNSKVTEYQVLDGVLVPDYDQGVVQ